MIAPIAGVPLASMRIIMKECTSRNCGPHAASADGLGGVAPSNMVVSWPPSMGIEAPHNNWRILTFSV